MYSANSLFETPGISMSAAKPFVCCDLDRLLQSSYARITSLISWQQYEEEDEDGTKRQQSAVETLNLTLASPAACRLQLRTSCYQVLL